MGALHMATVRVVSGLPEGRTGRMNGVSDLTSAIAFPSYIRQLLGSRFSYIVATHLLPLCPLEVIDVTSVVLTPWYVLIGGLLCVGCTVQ